MKQSGSAAQLGLFDIAPAESANRAAAYISPVDEGLVQKETARLIASIKTADNPGHESIV